MSVQAVQPRRRNGRLWPQLALPTVFDNGGDHDVPRRPEADVWLGASTIATVIGGRGRRPPRADPDSMVIERRALPVPQTDGAERRIRISEMPNFAGKTRHEPQQVLCIPRASIRRRLPRHE